MDEDTDMQDGDHLEYPDPRNIEHGPYPSISRSPYSFHSSSNSVGASPSLYRTLAPRPSNIGLTADSPSADHSEHSTHSDSDSNSVQYEDDDIDDIAELGGSFLDSAEPAPWTSDFFNRLAEAGNIEASESVDSSGRQRGRGRGSRGGRGGRGRGRGGWKWALMGTDHENLFKKPPLRGTGRYKRRKSRRNRGGKLSSVNASGQDWIDPGPEFNDLQRKATQAFLNAEYDQALEYAKAAVQVNSEVFMAHKMIDNILRAQGDERGAIIALSVGANTKRDPELWGEIGRRILELEDRTEKDVEWAKDCFSKASKTRLAGGDGYDARVGKLQLHEELEEWDQARIECRNIAKKWPEELDMVLKHARYCFRTHDSYDWERARELYEKAFEAYADSDMLGEDVDEQWTHLNVYLDILLRLGMYHEGIRQLRRLARWFLGRKDDAFWDDFIDDREFDSTHERRMHVWQFQQSHISQDNSQYGDGLPLELRIKLGLLRVRMRQSDEAYRHFEHLKAIQPEGDDDVEMFLEVAECMKNESAFGEALKYYEAIKPLQRVGDQRFWMGIAHCYNATGRKEDALECYLTCYRGDEYNINSRIELARLYDRMEEPNKAARMANEVVLLGKLDAIRRKSQSFYPAYGGQQARPFPLLLPKPTLENGTYGQSSLSSSEMQSLSLQKQRLTDPPRSHQKELDQFSSEMRSFNISQHLGTAQTKRKRIHGHYVAIRSFTAASVENDEKMADRWLLHARSIYTEFRSTNRFYFVGVDGKPSTQANSLPSNLVEEMEGIKQKAEPDPDFSDGTETVAVIGGSTVGEFHGVPLGECHRIFSELALLYAKRVDQDNCLEVLQNGLCKPNVFRLDEQMQITTQAVRLCCALMFNDGKLMTEVAQEFFSRDRNDSSAAAELLAATGRFSRGDAYLYGRSATKWVQSMLNSQENGRSGAEFGSLMLGGYLSLARSHANAKPALPYLLRALALQPKNPVTNLSIALAYIANAMRRDAVNRQVEIEQGLAFFYRYYDLRIASGEAGHLQEAEFNLARIWHQLGVAHLAVPAYGKVLRLSVEVRQEKERGDGADVATEDFAVEAAYALQGLYTAAGNEKAAKAITEMWLVL